MLSVVLRVLADASLLPVNADAIRRVNDCKVKGVVRQRRHDFKAISIDKAYSPECFGFKHHAPRIMNLDMMKSNTAFVTNMSKDAS